MALYKLVAQLEPTAESLRGLTRALYEQTRSLRSHDPQTHPPAKNEIRVLQWYEVAAHVDQNEEETNMVNAIVAEATRHGIGVFTMTNPEDYDTWEEPVEPSRSDAEYLQINNFIAARLTNETKSDLQEQFNYVARADAGLSSIRGTS